MAKYTMDMVLEYAKVFEENADRGKEDGPRAAQAIFAKGGQYVVNAYFTDEAQIEQLLKDGLDPAPMNSQRIQEGNPAFGIGKFVKMKRMISDIKSFNDRKTGAPVEIDYGGPVGVVNLTNGTDNKSWWTFSEDGPLGNGTEAKVQFELYANGAGIRLVNIGVISHVPFESTNTVTEDDKLFMVG
jgi:hypothetical protein